MLKRIVQNWKEDRAQDRAFEHRLPLSFKAARFLGGLIIYLLLLALLVRLELVIYYVYVTQAADLSVETAIPVGFVWGVMTAVLGLWLFPELVVVILWPILNQIYRWSANRRGANL